MLSTAMVPFPISSSTRSRSRCCSFRAKSGRLVSDRGPHSAANLTSRTWRGAGSRTGSPALIWRSSRRPKLIRCIISISWRRTGDRSRKRVVEVFRKDIVSPLGRVGLGANAKCVRSSLGPSEARVGDCWWKANHRNSDLSVTTEMKRGKPVRSKESILIQGCFSLLADVGGQLANTPQAKESCR
jgi:hypothetical protein